MGNRGKTSGGQDAWTAYAAAELPEAYGRLGTDRVCAVTRSAARTMAVHVVGATGVGAATTAYAPTPMIYLGASFGAMVGVIAGLLAVLVIAVLQRGAEWHELKILRCNFLAPSMLMVGLSTAWALLSLLEHVDRNSFEHFYAYETALTFGLPALLAPPAIRAAAAWCLAPSFPQARSTVNIPRMLGTAASIPAVAALLVLTSGGVFA